MTDHGPGSTSHEVEDDDYRLGAGEPQDAPASAAASAEADCPPPQVSGLPGWAHQPAAAAAPQLPRQSDRPADETYAQPYPLPGAYAVTGWPERQLPTLPPLPDATPTSGRPFQHATPPRKRLGRAALTGILAGTVALAAVVVTAVVLTFDDGDGAGTSPDSSADGVRTLSVGWTLPGSVSDHQVGTWVTGQYLVRGTQSGVRAYSLTDGTPAWTAQPLSGPTVPCAMSPTVSASGVGTVGFGPDPSDCTTVVGVDTRTGRTLWSTQLTSKDHADASPATTFVDGQVGVIVNATVLGGVDLTDGHVVWGYKPRGSYCNAYPYGGAGTVLVDDYCADIGSSYAVTALDAATGKQLWQKLGTDHVQFGTVLDGTPVVATLSGGSGAANVYDASGTPRPLTLKGRLDSGLGAVGASDSGARVVGASTLVLPVRDLTLSRPGLTAVNPTTGASLWSYDGQAHLGAVLARPQQATDSGRLHAVSLAPNYGDGAHPELVSLDPATGAATVLAKLPATPASLVYTAGTVYVLPDGRVLLVGADASGTAVRSFR